MKRLISVCGLAALLVACGDNDGNPTPGGPDAGGVPEGITYWQHVKPILDAKCAGCHVEGGIAPFTIDTYATALDHHEIMKEAVTNRIMPPWLAADGCSEYLDDRSLSDEQIELIAMWSEAGAPEGDAANEGPALDTGVSTGLSRVDRSIAMPAAYTAQTQPDDYRCFVLDWPETTTKFVTGFRANPGNPEVVHHVIAFYAPPDVVASVEALDAAEPGLGYTCFGGPGVNDSSWMGAWAPGSRGSNFPTGSGMRIVPGSKIVLQVHYNSLTAGVSSDLTSIDVKLDDTIDKEAVIQPFANPSWLSGSSMMIPAGEPDVMHSFTADLTFLFGSAPIDIHSVGYHQHVLGTHGRVELVRADTTRECMVDVPRWDFHWQGGYGFVQPKRMNPGDKIYLECHWDNSAANQPFVNGQQRTPQDVIWGEGTTDEMCLTSFYVTPAD